MNVRALALACCLLLPVSTGCAGGGGSLSVDVTNPVQVQEQNGDRDVRYDAIVTWTVDGYSGQDEQPLDVPESRAQLSVRPQLEAGSAVVTVTGPDGDKRFQQTFDAGASGVQRTEGGAEGTWTVAIDASDATGTVEVELS